jgi:hypothetical protein
VVVRSRRGHHFGLKMRFDHVAPKRRSTIDCGDTNLPGPDGIFFSYPCNLKLFHLVQERETWLPVRSLLRRPFKWAPFLLTSTVMTSCSTMWPTTSVALSLTGTVILYRRSLRSILNCRMRVPSCVATEVNFVTLAREAKCRRPPALLHRCSRKCCQLRWPLRPHCGHLTGGCALLFDGGGDGRRNIINLINHGTHRPDRHCRPVGIRLNGVDFMADVFGGFGGLLGEFFDFVGDDGKAFSSFPARAASMVAFKASKLVCWAMEVMTLMT